MNNKVELFPNINQYKVDLERKYLVRQNRFALSLISVIGILSVIYLVFTHQGLKLIVGLSLGFFVIIFLNILAISYSDNQVEFLKLNKFITSISFFTLMSGFVLYFKSPSFIPFLFIAYLIAAVYKDIKVLAIISLYFVFTMVMLLLNYKELFNFQTNQSPNHFVIGVFVILFLTLLMISIYITIKENQFFFNQISFSKEKETRNIELLIHLKDQIDVSSVFHPDYYDALRQFFDAFTQKIDSRNVFDEKLSVMEQLSKGVSKEEILKAHQDLSPKDLHRLEHLVLSQDSLLRKIAMHVFYYNQQEIHKREIFSETHFESFNKSMDDLEIKIVAFVNFYVLLKRGLTGMKPMSKDEIYHMLIHTDFSYSLHPKIREIYQENADVFETIYYDVFEEVVENE